MQKKIVFGFYAYCLSCLVGAHSFLVAGNKKLVTPVTNTLNNMRVQAETFIAEQLYTKALNLYQDILPIEKRDKEYQQILYKIAMINYFDQHYMLAYTQFKSFYEKYPKNYLSEFSLFYSGLCLYKKSPDYNLDQKNTYLAIDVLKKNMMKYPNSKKNLIVIFLIKNLSKKLEKKYFNIAKNYHDSMHYGASIKSCEQFIYAFPKSYLQEDVQYLILKNFYLLSNNQSTSLVKQRYLGKILNISSFFKTYYPNSLYTTEIQHIENNVYSILASIHPIF